MRVTGIKLGKYSRSNAVVFARPNAKKYGSYQAAAIRAPEVGAFNRFHRGNRGNILGHVPDRRIQLEEMRHRIARGLPARRMSTSEKEQLELFVNFLKSNNLVKYLKAKKLGGFALRYNGPPTPSAAITPALQKAYSKYKNNQKVISVCDNIVANSIFCVYLRCC